jgi:hypothetical protein
MKLPLCEAMGERKVDFTRLSARGVCPSPESFDRALIKAVTNFGSDANLVRLRSIGADESGLREIELPTAVHLGCPFWFPIVTRRIAASGNLTVERAAAAPL